MNSFFIHLKQMDWILIASVILLVSFSLLSLYSSSLGRGDFSRLEKQIGFAGIGLFLMFLFSFFDWRALKESPHFVLIAYILCLIVLVGLFTSLAPEIRGTKSWYKIGPFLADPIDLIKVVLITVLAKYFSMRHVEMYRIKHIFLSSVYVLLPSMLIFLQPNLGSALILVAIWLGILAVSGISLRQVLILALCFIIIFVLSWSFFLKDYQKDRIRDFLYPIDPLGSGWSQNQSKIAIGSGGFLGQGIGKGSQTQYGFLPEPQTDFIFSAAAEETGLAGVAALFSLFSILIWRVIRIGLAARSNFPRLFASGFVILLVSQIFINIGMNIGLLPVIGISLPFISYGGSSLLVLFIALGIIQNIKLNPA